MHYILTGGRRRVRSALLLLGALAAVAIAAGCGSSSSSSGSSTGGGDKSPIVVGSILDRTGPLNIYGKAMYDSTQLAIDDINQNGGVLGRKLQLKFYDAQSAQDKYTQYANQLALKDKPAVVMGGITSASREAIRPIFDRSKILYFYNEQYEGGVCDRNTFNTGVVPSQQLQALIPWTIKNVGPKLYVIAADYNYGQISADWVKKYAQQNGGQVVKTQFVPLDSSDFDSIIADLQKTKPDAVVSLLVGGNHIQFYRDFASTGLGSQMKIVSPTFGLGNEQVVLSPKESKGITVAYPYFQEISNSTNQAFVDKWHQRYGANYDYITDSAVTVWNGWHLWAEAVKKAGTTDRDKVTAALESGPKLTSPSGNVVLDGGSHHVSQDVSIAQTDGHKGFKVIDTAKVVPPSYENQVCNLKSNPTTNKQFTP
jgi:branched-chain amino acid transport system substrate-binding protein